MAPIRSIVQRATDATPDPATQMQMIRRIIEDIFGGSWGVLIIRNPALVSKIHWTIPDHNNSDGSPAFCLAVRMYEVNKFRWQYNVFKTGSKDQKDRVTVESIVNRFSFQKPKRV
ncbi:unnamed protein product [Heligmosomoides polygyrus]|uniref:Uncharacterized protein n=1 Tax=Heligmosomoides polygyrus TaxID=6339 RepID=A0A183FD44_HELPZ|nr:unnamed protein product [Heligmosomoides polygyrus]